MNLEEAKSYSKTMSEDVIAQMVLEHHRLKQELCAKSLLVPTGAHNWVNRSIVKAKSLMEKQRRLKKAVAASSIMLKEADQSTTDTACCNCLGTGWIEEEPCAICKGSGLAP